MAPMTRSAILLILVLLAAARTCTGEGDGGAVDRKRRGPWFCHRRDCPRFKTLDDEGFFSKRRYDRSTWAVSCAHDVHMPDAVLAANARVLNYVKENDLWGATPFSNVVRLSLENWQAWQNATRVSDDPSPKPSASTGHAAPADASLEGLVDEQALGCQLHKTICAAYYLPEHYQAGAGPARAEVDKRPPKPGKDSRVRIFRAPSFEAYVSGFPGFPTPPRFVWETMRLVHALKWEREEFDWRTIAFLVYNGPAEIHGRWNEVLIPARRRRTLADLIMQDGKELFREEAGAAEQAEVVGAEE